ncbi:hypothetical protein B6K89_00095 [Bacillus subtilis]|nr:hypothetical protein B6K89_00095 [Bacillus subtilis]
MFYNISLIWLIIRSFFHLYKQKGGNKLKKITIYIRDNCIHCHHAKSWLTENSVNFEEKNISSNKEYLEELETQKINGVPYTIWTDDTTNTNGAILGFNPMRFKKEFT